MRIESKIKSQAKFQTAARRESSEDSMKRAFLLIVLPALLAALGFAQTPAASIKTDQANIKGCLGGSDGNYTIAEDNTGHIFKITTSSVDLKPHLGHDVALIGSRASGVNSGVAGDSLAVTELNMISEHCAAAAAAPTAATVSTPSGTGSTPAPSAAAPAATVSTPSETAVTPAVAAAAPAATVSTPSETASAPAAATAAPAATVSTQPETASAPPAAAAPAATASTPSETASTPAAADTVPAATASTSSEHVSKPAVAAAHPTPQSTHHRKVSATPAAADTAPAAADTKAAAADTKAAAAGAAPIAAASTSAETASTPPEAAPTPKKTSRGWSLSMLIPFVVLVIVIGAMSPLISRWRKRKMLERTGAQNLSFNREASSDQNKSEKPAARKAA
jgi:hypothetical protein